MNGEWLGSRAIRCNWANQKVSSGASDSGPMDFPSVLSSTSPNNTTVYVGNLSADVNEHVLRSVFLEYGYIDEIRIQNSNPDKAFGFIKFATHDSAAKAIVHVNGKTHWIQNGEMFMGQGKRSRKFRHHPPRPSPFTNGSIHTHGNNPQLWIPTTLCLSSGLPTHRILWCPTNVPVSYTHLTLPTICSV
eukprot:TRINITY_DN5565_c0_g1_i6.p1 TRINITY_DN5565_c0_g1~~TRINITY_DN5565_c0_g1_i6.p1  ORF type:complete len:189 (-),score=8.23 TRINITY_DN5565_c0_g1_i6:8-574(-)